MAYPNVMSPLKAKSFLWLVLEEKVRGIQSMTVAPLLASKMEAIAHDKKCRWPLGQRADSIWQPAKKWGL